MHKNNFIVAIQDRNGNTLRERNEEIRLPFGEEYKIYLKNQESRKAQVSISINGKDVLDNNAIIVGSNETSIIEGYMKGNVITHRFKFIQKTEQIVEFQGDNPEHGFIRIEVRFEEKRPEPTRITSIEKIYQRDFKYPSTWWTWSSSTTGFDAPQTVSATSHKSMNFASLEKRNIDQEIQSEGLTVPGSAMNQVLNHTYIGSLESNSTVFTFRMLGLNTNGFTPIQNPVLTRTKIQCKQCGSTNSSFAKFCSHCGSSLTY